MNTSETDRNCDYEGTLAKAHAYRGRSVGSEETCHQFPGYDLCFDIGYAAPSSTGIPNVFITHGHGDHIGGLVRHYLRRGSWGMEQSQYFVPQWCLPGVREMFRGNAMVAGYKNVPHINLTGIEPGFSMPVGGRLTLNTFPSIHRIPTIGYSLLSKRNRLKSEYVGMAGTEIGRLKREGVPVTEEFEAVEIAYPGDTEIRVLDSQPMLSTARVLLLECSFVDDAVSPKDASDKGHVHIQDILNYGRAGYFKNECVLLTHFSARYTSRYIHKMVQTILGKEDWAIGRFRMLLPGLPEIT